MLSFSRVLLFSIPLSLGAAPAFAYWEVQKSDEDVFGNINVTATSIGDNGTLLRFECGSGKPPLVAFLVRDNSGDFEPIPAEILMKASNGTVTKVDAQITPWNEEYVAIQTSNEKFLTALSDEMISTSKSIPIGAEVVATEFKVSDTFSSQGSTAAGNMVKSGCLEKKEP